MEEIRQKESHGEWKMKPHHKHTAITALAAAVIISGFALADTLNPFTGLVEIAGQFYPMIPIGLEVAIVLIARFLIFRKQIAQEVVVSIEQGVSEIHDAEFPEKALCDPRKVLTIPENIIDDGTFDLNPLLLFIEKNVGVPIVKGSYVLARHGNKRLLILTNSFGKLTIINVTIAEGRLYKFSGPGIANAIKLWELQSGQVGPV